MTPPLGRLTLCGICRVATIGASQKQKSRHLCNFFAIRGSFLFPESRNTLLNSRLPALLHRDPRSEKPISIANRKKVAIRADFLFLVSSQWLRGGVGAGEPKLGAARGFECGSNLALRNKSTTVWAWCRKVIRRWSGRDPGSYLRDDLGAIQVRRCG